MVLIVLIIIVLAIWLYRRNRQHNSSVRIVTNNNSVPKKYWLKFALWFGIIGAIISLGDFAAVPFVYPILPVIIFSRYILLSLYSYNDTQVTGILARFIISPVTFFVGYFLWGALIGWIYGSRKNNL